jgi:hypothetical protein
VFVRFGAEADKATVRGYVRFTPKSGQTGDIAEFAACGQTMWRIFI